MRNHDKGATVAGEYLGLHTLIKTQPRSHFQLPRPKPVDNGESQWLQVSRVNKINKHSNAQPTVTAIT